MFLTLTPRRPQNDTISDANLAVSDFPNEQQCFTLKEHEQQQQRINAERLLASPHALFLWLNKNEGQKLRHDMREGFTSFFERASHSNHTLLCKYFWTQDGSKFSSTSRPCYKRVNLALLDKVKPIKIKILPWKSDTYRFFRFFPVRC